MLRDLNNFNTCLYETTTFSELIFFLSSACEFFIIAPSHSFDCQKVGVTDCKLDAHCSFFFSFSLIIPVSSLFLLAFFYIKITRNVLQRKNVSPLCLCNSILSITGKARSFVKSIVRIVNEIKQIMIII